MTSVPGSLGRGAVAVGVLAAAGLAARWAQGQSQSPQASAGVPPTSDPPPPPPPHRKDEEAAADAICISDPPPPPRTGR